MCTKWCCSTWYQGWILEQIQDLKSFLPYLVRVTWYSQYTHITKNSHKINPTKSHHLKWHQDLFFEENPDVDSEIWNCISSTRYGYICILATLRENLTSANQSDLYIIWTRIARRIQIQSQKFEILPVAPAMAIFIFQPHSGNIWPSSIRII